MRLLQFLATLQGLRLFKLGLVLLLGRLKHLGLGRC